MSSPNWPKLIAEGRARGYGVPATDAELQARALGIPKEYYFNGIHTLEAYEEAKKAEATEGKPLERMTVEELTPLAKATGTDVTPDATAEALVDVVKAKKGKKK